MSTQLTPYLIVREADKAIDFYKRAFGAKEPGARILDQEGKIGHAELHFGDFRLYIADEHPDSGAQGPHSLGGSTVRLVLNVPDVDVTFKAALEAGAKELIPVEDRFYGERGGRLEDPFGHVWLVSTTLDKNVSPEEMERASGGAYRAVEPN